MTNWLTSAGAAVALACMCVPAAAQDEADVEAATVEAMAMEGFVGNELIFEVEPLTPEQEARLPAATRLVDIVMQDGGTDSVPMGILSGLLGSEADYPAPNALDSLHDALGYAYYNDDLAPSKAERAVAILDPQWRERHEVQAVAMRDYIAQMRAAMAPAMRQALAEIYAIRFTDEQLGDIEAFLRTDSGIAYARESTSISNDPRIYNAMMSSPWFTGEAAEVDFAAMQEELEALPQRPTFEQLAERDRALVSALLGLEDGQLEAMMSGAMVDAMEAAAEAEAIMEEVD
ncbi:hypothetical protein [Aurantiacibacter sp. D1-12]|uniref:hypothetical protein n=1 Tax=Aurantiacibacter sp. D1-12 TaxID=2993658 RepID=UPI00237CB6D0|nr:hypothetical protein [Aurantiacibacter sp. D1-12]MDE1468031.1 hypothetical protein [Aurantiacibacter sp. D1-12]